MDFEKFLKVAFYRIPVRDYFWKINWQEKLRTTDELFAMNDARPQEETFSTCKSEFLRYIGIVKKMESYYYN